ncbi:MAG: response regulator [Bdellovibrionota bacterium]
MADNDRILIIEDEQDIRSSLQEILELEGYSVLAAANGKEGLELAIEGPYPFMILLDLTMPIMDGWEFLAARKDHSILAGVPVVVFSATRNNIEATRNAGADDFIKKPIGLDPLLEVVRKYQIRSKQQGFGQQQLSPA